MSTNATKPKTQAEMVWEYIHANPGQTTPEMARGIGMSLSSVSSCVTALRQTKQLSFGSKTFINDSARKQTLLHYSTIGAKFKPVSGAKKSHGARPHSIHPTALIQATQDEGAATAQVIIMPQRTPPAEVAALTEAEEFKAFLEFKALKAAGHI